MIDERDVATMLCPDLDRPLDEVLQRCAEIPAPSCEFSPSPVPDPEPATPDEPQRIGGCVIKQIIGRGGQGTVYEADTEEGERVAIKLFHPLRSGKPNLGRFRREAETLGQLQHPGIASLRGSGLSESGQPYLIMDFIGGHTLRRHVEGLNCEQRLALFIDICNAVQAAHDQGIVHRDLKPSNILIDHDGVPKVCDFGLARFVDRDPNHQQLSEGGRLIGTPRYMSPEQIRGEEMDTRSDIYSLGLILYQLLTDTLPYTFDNSSLYHAAQVVCGHVPPRPTSINSTLDKRLDAILLKALEKDPARRYASVKAMAIALERVLRRRQKEQKTKPRSKRVRGKWASVRLTCAGIILGMAFGAVHGVVGVQQNAIVAARLQTASVNRARLESKHYSVQVNQVLNNVVKQLPADVPAPLSTAAALHTALALNCRALGLDVRAGEHLGAAARLMDSAAKTLLSAAEPSPSCPTASALPTQSTHPTVPPRCVLR